ncbi:MAG: TadE family protein [Myxococcaceae bacterium]
MRGASPSLSRGQAAVELALGMLVFVTILMFGIHFAEITTISMKVTEAAAAPVWDATSGRMHTIPWSYDPGGAVNRAVSDARARYQDFDGRISQNGTTGPSQVFTQASGMQISCRVGGVNTYWGQLLPLPFIPVIYRDNGGMSCTAEARISTYNIPTSYNEGAGGLFQDSHKSGTALNSGIKVCAVGRPAGLNGPCQGQFGMMIDDWGLADSQQEDGICAMIPLPFGIPCVPNINYWSAVFAIYQMNGAGQGSAHQALVQQVVGSTPLFMSNVTDFYMSFMGEESFFLQLVIAGDGGDIVWWTSPFLYMPPSYSISWGMRKNCYLGLDQCASSTLAMP